MDKTRTLRVNPIVLAAMAGELALGCAKGVTISRIGNDQPNPSSVQSPPSADPSDPSARDPSTRGPRGTPVEVPSALGLARSQVQTRGTLLLPIMRDRSQLYDTVQLIREGTGQTLVSTPLDNDPSSPLANPDPSLNRGWLTLAATSEYVLTSATAAALDADLPSGPDLMLRLMPIALTQSKKLSYGSNHLRLILTGTDHDITASRQMVVRDFSYFGLGTASFADGRWHGQDRAQGYQGRAAMAVGHLVRSGTSELKTGSVTILSH